MISERLNIAEKFTLILLFLFLGCKDTILPLSGAWTGSAVSFNVSAGRDSISNMQISRPNGSETAVDWVHESIPIKQGSFTYSRSGNSFLGISGFAIEGTFISKKLIRGKLNGQLWEATPQK